MPIVVVTTDPPQTVVGFSQRLAQRYPHLKLLFTIDAGGRMTEVYCGGATPRAFLVDAAGRLRWQQGYQESDEEAVLHIREELGGERHARTVTARQP